MSEFQSVTPETLIADLRHGFGLSVRAWNCLRNVRSGDGTFIETIGDLISLTRREVLAARNLGRMSLFEIENFLSHHGLALAAHITPSNLSPHPSTKALRAAVMNRWLVLREQHRIASDCLWAGTIASNFNAAEVALLHGEDMLSPHDLALLESVRRASR